MEGVGNVTDDTNDELGDRLVKDAAAEPSQSLNGTRSLEEEASVVEDVLTEMFGGRETKKFVLVLPDKLEYEMVVMPGPEAKSEHSHENVGGFSCQTDEDNSGYLQSNADDGLPDRRDSVMSSSSQCSSSKRGRTTSAKRWNLCVSSQVGCKLGCVFCETGRMGLLRSLSTDQITAQVSFDRDLLIKKSSIAFTCPRAQDKLCSTYSMFREHIYRYFMRSIILDCL